MIKFQLAASVAALALSVAAPAFAQGTYSLSGTAVPEDQVANIQAHCDTLFAAEGTAETATDSTDDTADDAAPTFSDDDSSESETPVDFATLDITTITIEDCRAGGFIADAPTDGAAPAASPSPGANDAGSTTSVTTTN